MGKNVFSIVLVVLVCMLLVGVALAQPGGGPSPPTLYTMVEGSASGEGYHLTSLNWRVNGTVSGGGYRLLGPAASPPPSAEVGCCCTYVPCLMRNY